MWNTNFVFFQWWSVTTIWHWLPMDNQTSKSVPGVCCLLKNGKNEQIQVNEYSLFEIQGNSALEQIQMCSGIVCVAKEQNFVNSNKLKNKISNYKAHTRSSIGSLFLGSIDITELAVSECFNCMLECCCWGVNPLFVVSFIMYKYKDIKNIFS